MKRISSLILCAALALGFAASAQENQVKRLPEVSRSNSSQHDMSDNETGFWFSPELSAAYSCRLNHTNFGYSELDFTGGYRFSQYLKVGVGVGSRYYFDNNKIRCKTIKWGFPLYATVRGNFINEEYRTVLPYYSLDFGGTIQDGVMVRPSIGLRIGQPRQAFIIALSYVGQQVRSYRFDTVNDSFYKKIRLANFIALRLGYEF